MARSAGEQGEGRKPEMTKLGALKKEHEGVKARIEAIGPERKATEERLAAAERADAARTSEMESLRKERQRILADGGDPAAITRKIDELRHKDEIIDDEMTGLRQKLFDLNDEEKRHNARKIELLEAICKEETRPMVERYNKLAVDIALVLTELDQAIADFDTLQIPGRTMNELLQASTGGQIPHLVGRIWFYGEEKLDHAFDRRSISEKRQLEQTLRHLESMVSPECECLQCKHYMGVVDRISGLICRSFRGPIPRNILSGAVKHRSHLHTEPHVFEPREIDKTGSGADA